MKRKNLEIDLDSSTRRAKKARLSFDDDSERFSTSSPGVDAAISHGILGSDQLSNSFLVLAYC